ncbi:MAG: hypothetical protein EB101_05480 [Chitinophagia bacterium]|nr:hypothetical protein [Chitinophagia bacterium]
MARKFSSPESIAIESAVNSGDSGYTVNFSPEGQKLLDYYRAQYGIPLEVQPVAPEEYLSRPGLQGYFKSQGSTAGGYGGSTDPLRRTVFTVPGTSAHVLAHEAGHAYDPVLLRSNLQIGENARRFGPALYEAAFSGRAAQDPGSFLNAYIDLLGPRNVMQTEATAQREAKRVLGELNIEHPEKDAPWFHGYPRSFVDRGLAGATAAMTAPALPDNLKSGIIDQALGGRNNFTSRNLGIDANTVVNIGDERTRKIIDLALNPAYQKAVSDIESRTQTYLNRQLGAQPDDYMYDTKNLFWGGR